MGAGMNSAASAAPMRYDGTSAHCPRCGAETATGLLRLSSGHIGRVCCRCRVLRKGKPYASRAAYMFSELTPPPPMPARAEGSHEAANQ